MEKVIRTICGACHSECGVLVHVRDGKAVKIKGDPNHPVSKGYCCVKGRAQVQMVHHPSRLTHPMRRVGKRGEGKWMQISWDEALNGIAEKLTQIKGKYGMESFATVHGTGPRSSFAYVGLLATALGSPNQVSTDFHICIIPSLVAEHATYGPMIMHESGPDHLNTNCIMVIGANPLAAHPAQGMEILEAKRKRKAKLIVVDPRYTELAAKADLWLQIRPGTDAALALGMIKIIIDEELFDREFVADWCHGFDKLEERVKEYPLNKVSEITWIPENKILEATRMYATIKPSTLYRRVAIEHNTNSTQSIRAIASLIALTGNIDVPGGNLLPNHIPGDINIFQLLGIGPKFSVSPDVAAKRLGAKEYPLTSGLEAPLPFVVAPLLHQAIRTGEPYPITSVFLAGGNPLNMQNAKSVWQCFKNNLELLVVVDFFPVPFAEIADFVLPAATWMEREDVCGHMATLSHVAARQKVVEPIGEAWDDLKIVQALVKKVPWANQKMLFWKDTNELNEATVRGSGVTFKELKEKGYLVNNNIKYKKYEGDGFRTPTKKVELYSTIFEKHGYDPLPSFEEPPESPISTPKLLKKYPLILYTGGRHIEFFHSEGRQIPAMRKRIPDPLVEINPETARKNNIDDGDWVWLETPQVKNERVRLRAKLTHSIHPSMAHARHGWWFPEKPGPEHGCFESNINVVLTDDLPRDKICASVRSRGSLCRIYK
jgi:thiosulfate reductase/polysulfide reductase chain A